MSRASNKLVANYETGDYVDPSNQQDIDDTVQQPPVAEEQVSDAGTRFDKFFAENSNYVAELASKYLNNTLNESQAVALLKSFVVDNNIKISEKLFNSSQFGKAFKDYFLSDIQTTAPIAAKYLDLYNINRAAQEYKVLGQTLGINAGMGSTEFYLYKFRERLDQFVAVPEFDTIRFINALVYGDQEYVNAMIDGYEKIKEAHNIPFILANNKHFIAQLHLIAKSDQWLKTISYKSSNVEKLKAKFDAVGMMNRNELPEKEFKALGKIMDDMATDAYYKSLPEEQRIINAQTTVRYPNGESKHFNQINLGTAEGKDAFIKWMHQVIQLLKSDPQFQDNSFVQDLAFTAEKMNPFGTKYGSYRIMYDQSNADNDYAKIKIASVNKAFQKLGNLTIDNNSYDLQTMFTHYNRLLNGDSMSSNSLTKFIGMTDEMKRFFDFQANSRDTFNLDQYNPDKPTLAYLKAKYGLTDTNPKSKGAFLAYHQESQSMRVYYKKEDGSTKLMNPTIRFMDFKAPLAVTLGNKVQKIDTDGGTLTQGEDQSLELGGFKKSKGDNIKTLNELGNRLKTLNPDINIELLSNEEMVERGYPNDKIIRGIYNEDQNTVYINIDHASTADMLHEFGHVMMSTFATYNPASYETVVQMGLEHPLAQVIAEEYGIEGNRLGEEVIVTLLGEHGREKMHNDAEQSWWTKFRTAFEDFINQLIDTFKRGFRLKKDIFDVSSQDLMKMDMNQVLDQFGDKILKQKVSGMKTTLDVNPVMEELLSLRTCN